jgi:hypothetical protein
VIAPPAYEATSLVWCRRDWLLAQPDPRAVLDRRADAGPFRRVIALLGGPARYRL